jgi:glycosyltransferase involved in cell wall biosynthesis
MRLWVVEPNGFGGLIHFSFELCQALAKEGHQVNLITSRSYELEQEAHSFTVDRFLHLWNPVLSNNDDQRGGISAQSRRILRRSWRGIVLTKEWARLTHKILRDRPDVVIFSEILFPHLGGFLWFMKRHRLKLLQVCHEFQYQERERGRTSLRLAFSKFLYKQFDLIFFLSRDTQREFLMHFQFPAAQTGYIPHGSQRIFPRATMDREKFCASLGVSFTQPVLLFFGALRPSKGLDQLLRAYAICRNRDQAWLVIAGKPTKLLDVDKLVELARTLGIASRVVFRSEYIPIDQVASYFEIARAVVLPYVSATQSGVLHLAYHFGRPVVATAVGGLSEDVRPGISGLLVPPGDVRRLADALDTLIADPSLARRLGEKAAGIACNNSSWATAARTIIKTAENCSLTS